jgi:hypothetical protein
VHLALARPQGEADPWLIVSDELTGLQTFEEYGLRFDIEIYQPYNLCKTLAMMMGYRQGVATAWAQCAATVAG